MEHIDWIVSFVIFVFVILIVITAIPKFLPEITSQEEIYTSKLIFSNLTEKIDTYNIFSENKEKSQMYFLEIQEENGRANHNYIYDSGMLYGNIIGEGKFYVFDSNKVNTKTLIFKENFIDENNLKYVIKNDGRIINFKGEAYAFENTEIETINNYSNFYLEFIMEPKDVNIYFNYQNSSNYSVCELKNNLLKLYDVSSSITTLSGTIDINSIKENLWVNFSIYSNYNGKVECKINNYSVNSNTHNSTKEGKIFIKNYEDYFISSLEIYYNNFLLKNENEIETYNYRIVNNGSIMTINAYDNDIRIGQITVNLIDGLYTNQIENDNPALIINNYYEHKAILFPNTKEMLIILEPTPYDFTINEDLNIDIYDNNKIYLKNSNLNKYVLLDFFKIDGQKTLCIVNITDQYSFNLDCKYKTFIKIRIEDQNISPSKINYFKAKEEMITFEKIINYYSEYYIKIYNNKENIEIGENKFTGNYKLLEKVSKYLNNKGQEEIVKVLIKPN